MNPKTLDHVALWVSDRDGIAARLEDELGLREIERTERFTLLGRDARGGKLTLFAADGPREPGSLKHVALRVSSLEGAPAALHLGDGLELRLVEAPTESEYDLDHLALVSAEPTRTARAYERLGFAPAGPARVEVGGAYVEFHEGDPGEPERPLLNHLGLLVDSAEAHRAEAEELGIEVADWVDAPNTLAVFVWAPERVKVEYVEHKPTFSLR